MDATQLRSGTDRELLDDELLEGLGSRACGGEVVL